MDTPSNLIRTPAQVAQMMRYTAARLALMPSLPRTTAQLLGTLIITWAETLEGAPRAPLAEVAADHLDLATEIETTADAIAAECMVAGGRFALEPGDAPGFIAWLREAARQAAALARGGELTAKRAEPASPRRDTRGMDLAPAPHPDDVVPGLETGTGDPVTMELMRRLAAMRAQRVDVRPCDTEETNHDPR